MDTDLDNHRSKCRCCFKLLESLEEPTTITNNIENRFFDITQLELKSSFLCSTNICKSCDIEMIRFFIFKSELTTKQLKLYQYLDDQNTSNEYPKFNEISSSSAIKYEDTANPIKLETEFFEPEVKIKTEPDILDIKLNHYFSAVNNYDGMEDNIYASTSISSKSHSKKSSKSKTDDYGRIKSRSPYKKKKDESPSDFVCPICKKVFTEKRKVKPHILRMHLKIKNHSCDICGYAAFTKFDILRHQKSLHLPPDENSMDLRVCPDCGKSFKGNNHLTFHIRKKHLKIKRFLCDLCSYSAYERSSFQSHMTKMHVAKELRETYPCNLCSAILSAKESLSAHLRTKHNNIRPHKCFCGKAFYTRTMINMHIRTVHKGERNHECNICHKRYAQAGKLKEHITVVHGEKLEIPCEHCGKIFNSMRNFNNHKKYHEEPKFKCGQCNKTFHEKKVLKNHQDSHIGFVCEVCNKSFQWRSSLQKHQKKSHNM